MTGSTHIFRRPSSYCSIEDDQRSSRSEAARPAATTAITTADTAAPSLSGGVTETSPLLPPNDNDEASLDAFKTPPSLLERHVIICLTVILIFFTSGIFLQEAPLTQIYEVVVCENYYRQVGNHTLHVSSGGLSSVDNPCKIDPIQSEVAWIQGIIRLMEFVPTTFLAIPYSRLSNRIGRRPVLLLSLLGVGLEYLAIFTICWFGYILPIRLVFLAPLLTAIGGGATVAASMLFAIVSDVTPIEYVTHRFYVLGAVEFVATAVCRTLSSPLMEWNRWLSMIIGNICFLLSCLAVFAMPETRHLGLQKKHVPLSLQSVRSEEADSPKARLSHWTRLVRSCRSAGAMLTQHRFVLLTFFLIFFQSFAERVSNFILLYASKRYELPYAQANYFNSYLTIVRIIILLGILPATGWFMLDKLHMTPYYKSISTAFCSCALNMAGSVVLGLGREIVSAVIGITLFGMGIGAASNLRTLMIMYAPADHVTQCHTIFNLFRDLAEAVSGPLYSFTFAKGLQLGSHWVGLPFQVSAMVFSIVTLAIALVWIRSAATAVRT